MSDIYQKQLKWAKKRGLFIDDRVERKVVNGVAGLYVTDDVPAGQRLIAYPIDKTIKNLDDKFYKEDISDPVKQMHAALLEFCKGESSDYYGHFMQFETLEELKSFSTFFYTPEDLNLIESMNFFLAKSIHEINDTITTNVHKIKQLEPNIDEATIILVVLNYHSRAWGDANFLPIIDYANHSDRMGKQRGCKNGEYLLEAKQAYKKGDEIFLSYGRKDMYLHAIYYNYFDPNGVHYIQYGPRFMQVAESQIEKEIAKYTATKFRLEMSESDGKLHYCCLLADLCFLENAPSLSMIDYIKANYFPSMKEWQQKQCSAASLAQRLLDIINIMISANNVDKFKLSALPKKMHRFHALLKKEKQMLLKNKEWVIDNFYL